MRGRCFSDFSPKVRQFQPVFLVCFSRDFPQNPKAPNCSSGDVAWKPGRPRTGWVSSARAAYLLFRERQMLDGGQLVNSERHMTYNFLVFKGWLISGEIMPGMMAAFNSGRFGLVRSFLPFRGLCHLSGNSCERGACADFSGVVPRRLLPWLANRSWMKLGCKQRKDVG